ncbi:hypothetical protein AAVH_30133 [Aphelenchoides avenae]|nr:hypothetical protein AAVH_30133 [Aphelenchus avenae]
MIRADPCTGCPNAIRDLNSTVFNISSTTTMREEILAILPVPPMAALAVFFFLASITTICVCSYCSGVRKWVRKVCRCKVVGSPKYSFSSAVAETDSELDPTVEFVGSPLSPPPFSPMTKQMLWRYAYPAMIPTYQMMAAISQYKPGTASSQTSAKLTEVTTEPAPMPHDVVAPNGVCYVSVV